MKQIVVFKSYESQQNKKAILKLRNLYRNILSWTYYGKNKKVEFYIGMQQLEPKKYHFHKLRQTLSESSIETDFVVPKLLF